MKTFLPLRMRKQLQQRKYSQLPNRRLESFIDFGEIPPHRSPYFRQVVYCFFGLRILKSFIMIKSLIEFLSQVLPGPYFCHFATNAILELQFNHGYYIITYITPNMHFALWVINRVAAKHMFTRIFGVASIELQVLCHIGQNFNFEPWKQSCNDVNAVSNLYWLRK